MSDGERRQAEAPLTAHPAACEGPEAWANVWSGGQVLGFSGLDGPTNWATAIGARTLASRAGLTFDVEPAVTVVLHVVADGKLYEALPGTGRETYGSVRSCHIDNARLRLSLTLGSPDQILDLTLGFAAKDVVRGVVRYGNQSDQRHEIVVVVDLEGVSGSRAGGTSTPIRFDSECLTNATLEALPEVLRDHAEAGGIPEGNELYQAALAADGGESAACQFAIAFGEAAEKPVAPLDEAQMNALENAPEPLTPPPSEGLSALMRSTRAKAIAILRANTFAPEGNLPRRWIVTQRLRHRNFNTFHAPFLAIGALTFDPELAVDVMRCALAQQQANGLIPEQAWPEGQTIDTPPPLLCWGFWKLYQSTGDRDMIEDATARLKDYVKYPLATRLLERLGHARSSGAKFLTWGRGEGSNMDNSPRFDYTEAFAAIDLTSYAVSEIHYVAQIIEQITPNHREAVHLAWMGDELAREVQEYFWDQEGGCFVDRYPDDDPVDANTSARLIPLFAGVPTEEQAKLIVEQHLLNPDEFWTSFPLSSLAADDQRYDQNMWRGGTWPGINLLIIEGLRRYGYDEVAARLREETLDRIAHWYQETGSLWEFYDSSDERPPSLLPRGRRTGALPDYAWTAATFLALLHETDAR